MKRLAAFLALALTFVAPVIAPEWAIATVNEQTARNSSVGDGSTTAFSFTFKIITKNDIEVLVDGVTKTVDSDYTVTGMGVSGGGTVTFTTAPASAAKVTLLRKQAAAQASDYIAGQSFPAEGVEKDLDKLAMQVQQDRETLARTLRARKHESLDMTLPAVSSRASRVLGFDSTGLPTAVDLDAVGGDASLSTVIASGSTTARSLATRLAEVFNVLDWGADPTGVADSTTAIQAANDAVEAAGGGVLVFPKGTYNVSATLIIDTPGVTWMGLGSGNAGTVTIRATHSAGPVVRVKSRSTTIQHIAISSTSARYSGTAGSNYGIQLEGPDTSTASMSKEMLSDLLITNQPSHGLVMIGTLQSSIVEQVTISYNFGHGLVIDSGTLTSRSNLHQPGIIELRSLHIIGNAGNGLALGVTGGSLQPFRIHIVELECADNAWNSGVYYYHSQLYSNSAVNIMIEASAFGDAGYADTTLANGATRTGKAGPSEGVLASGQSWTIAESRFISLSKSVHGGSLLDGITITNPIIAQGSVASQAVGFQFASTTTGLRFYCPLTTGMTQVIQNTSNYADIVVGAKRYIGINLSTHSGWEINQPKRAATISGGTLTVTGDFTTMAGQGGAADDLDNILLPNGNVPLNGLRMTLVNTNAYDITVKHGTGNIKTRSGSDVVLGQNQAITLISDSTNLFEF